MSGTRNKRKRQESETPAKRRSRESRGSNEAPIAPPPKSEAKRSISADPPSDISTAAPSKTSKETPSEPAVTVPGTRASASSAPATSPHPKNHSPILTSDAHSSTSSTAQSQVSQHPPLHRMGNPLAPRDVRIRELIKHRTILLERSKLCRNAAETRLANMPQQTDAQELSQHREKAKEANLSVKKSRQQQEGGERFDEKGEKRTSVSLRRGSGVGKRMNAALSSLAPGSGGVAPTIDVSAISSSSGAATTATSSAVVKKGRQTPRAATTPSARSNGMSSMPTPTASNSSYHHSTNKKSHSFSADPRSQQPGYPHKSVPTLAGAPRFPPDFRTLDSGLVGNSSLPPNMLSRMQPETHFPEAIRLRGNRDRITVKLNQLLGKANGTMPTQPTRPQELPRRRKTHWDNLLLEMKWMATDFIQERNHKVAVSRSLATHLPNNDGCPIVPSKLREQSTTATPSIIDASKVETSTLEESGDEVMEEKDQIQDDHSAPKSSEARGSRAEQRSYHAPSEQDTDKAQIVSKLASTLLSEVSERMAAENWPSINGDMPSAGPSNYQRIRAQLLGEQVVAATQNEAKMGPLEKEDESKGTNGKVEPSIESGSAVGTSELVEKSFDAICSQIHDLHQVGRVRGKPSTKDFDRAWKGGRLALSSKQKEVVATIDKIWDKEPAPAAVVSGVPTSGKTVAVASALWKHRTHGAQLLVCEPTTIVRWRYELCRFTDIQVLLLGPGGVSEASSYPSEQKEMAVAAKVVVLCEYGFVSIATQHAAREGYHYYSVAADFRNLESRLDQFGDRKSSVWGGPSELLSQEWWKMFLSLAMKSSRRLLLDYSVGNPLGIATADLSKLDHLDLLAYNTLFVTGDEVFKPTTIGIPRCVLVWARKKGADTKKDKFERIQTVFRKTLEPVTSDLEDPIGDSDTYEWETIGCQMTLLQREAYDNCCMELRGALSTDLNEHNDGVGSLVDPYKDIAIALHRLRRQCFHANTDARFGRCHGFSPQKTMSSPAQPDAEYLHSMLKESGKLRRLLKIFSASGYDFEHCDLPGEAKKELLSPSDPTDGHPKKIAIFADMLEIRILVSRFLKAAGIRHIEAFSEKSAQPTCLGDSDWVHTQSRLESFNSQEEDENAVRVFVGSHDNLLGRGVGIGVDSADVVVSVDEDWSGRTEVHMHGVLSRWHAHQNLMGKDVKLVRLVCSETVETRVFDESTPSESQDSAEEDQAALPLCGTGEYDFTAMTESSFLAYKDSDNSFPLANILKMRGTPLTQVLLPSKQLPQLLGSIQEMLFLKGNTNDAKLNVANTHAREELQMTRALVLLERHHQQVENVTPFPFGLMTRKDVHDVTLLRYLHLRSAETSDTNVSQTALLRTPNGTSTGSPQIPTGGARVSSFGHPGELSPPLLFYRESASEEVTEARGRTNAFSKSFSHCTDLLGYTGSQGSEPVVYFPPILPRTQECSKSALCDSSSNVQATSLPSKRKEVQDNPAPNSKRARTSQDGQSEAPNASAKSVSVVGAIGSIPKNGSIVAEEEKKADPNSVSSRDKEISDNLVQRSESVAQSEDFGVYGHGAIPVMSDLATVSAFESVSSSVGISAGLSNDDQGQLAMMMLFIKKLQRSGQTDKYPVAIRTSAPLDWRHGLIGNGEDISKKDPKKKNVLSLFAAGAATHGMPRTGHKGGTIKEMHRRRVASYYGTRQCGSGLSMFESAPFRVAAVRVQSRVLKRVERAQWKTMFDIGSGLPMQPSIYPGADTTRWRSISIPLRDKSSTGDADLTAANKQRAAFQKCMMTPYKVDFGPFCVGFLSAPAGMTGLSLPRSRLGVSLPMGVKTHQPGRDQSKLQWQAVDDDMLLEYAQKLGKNWILLARVMSTIKMKLSSKSYSISSRQCRDRWLALTGDETVVANSTSKLIEKNSGYSLLPGIEGRSLLSAGAKLNAVTITPEEDKEPEKGTSTDDSKPPATQSPVNKFARVTSAETKRLVIPLTIPGSVGGNTAMPPPMVAAHPSHVKSVQSSIGAKWSSGKTKMWPLQILDCADQHRTSRIVDTRRNVPNATAASRRPHSSTAQSHSHGHRGTQSATRPMSFPPVPSNTARSSGTKWSGSSPQK